jgi:hypothetical protein
MEKTVVDGTKFRKKIISKQVIKFPLIETLNHSMRRNCNFIGQQTIRGKDTWADNA